MHKNPEKERGSEWPCKQSLNDFEDPWQWVICQGELHTEESLQDRSMLQEVDLDGWSYVSLLTLDMILWDVKVSLLGFSIVLLQYFSTVQYFSLLEW